MSAFLSRHSRFRVFWNILLLTAGSIVYSVGIACFVDPNHIASGGFSGVAILINHLLPIGTGTYIFLFNIPLMIIGAVRFKWPFFLSTLYTIVSSSVLVDVIEEYILPNHGAITQNMMLAAVIGGVLIAVGMGLAFHGGGCTGGTDIVVKLLRQRFKSVKSGKIFFILDLAVILASMLIFSVEEALYATISVFVTSVAFDYVLYGPDGAMVIYIVSANSQSIANRILREINCGVTFLRGEGAYTGTDRDVLMCAFHKYLYSRVRDVVQSEDPEAFMIITSAHEILGEGFKDPFADEI